MSATGSKRSQDRKKPRRGKGEGTIFERKPGQFVAQVSLGTEDGHRKRITVYGASKSEVQAKLVELTHLRNKGTLVDPSTVTVKEYLTEWIDTHEALGIADKTAESYRYMIQQYLIPQLGKIKLKDLKPQHVQKAYANLLRQEKRTPEKKRKDPQEEERVKEPGFLSAGTVNGAHRVLRAALNTALRQETLARNPLKGVKAPPAPRKRFAVLDDAQVRTFLTAAQGHRLFALFLLAVSSGMRPGELLGLRWPDVDTENMVIRVQQALQRLKRKGEDRKLKETKTESGRRAVDVPASVIQALNDHRARQQSERDLVGEAYQDRSLVFCQPNGKPLDGQYITKVVLAKLLKKAGLPRLCLYDLRHTHATLLLLAGVHPKVVSERLGHSSIELTMNTYSHVLPSMQKGAAEKMESLLAAPLD